MVERAAPAAAALDAMAAVSSSWDRHDEASGGVSTVMMLPSGESQCSSQGMPPIDTVVLLAAPKKGPLKAGTPLPMPPPIKV